jgi:hypothetical protein
MDRRLVRPHFLWICLGWLPLRHPAADLGGGVVSGGEGVDEFVVCHCGDTDCVGEVEIHTPERQATALEVLQQLVLVRPCNWDDDDDAEQRDAWRAADAFIASREPCEGWKPVPIEPTREMWAAMGTAAVKAGPVHHDVLVGAVWVAGVAAAKGPASC